MSSPKNTAAVALTATILIAILLACLGYYLAQPIHTRYYTLNIEVPFAGASPQHASSSGTMFKGIAEGDAYGWILRSDAFTFMLESHDSRTATSDQGIFDPSRTDYRQQDRTKDQTVYHAEISLNRGEYTEGTHWDRLVYKVKSQFDDSPFPFFWHRQELVRGERLMSTPIYVRITPEGDFYVSTQENRENISQKDFIKDDDHLLENISTQLNAILQPKIDAILPRASATHP